MSSKHATRLAIVHGTDLADQRDRLVAKLEAQDTWLRDHPDHPDFEQRVDLWIANLREYERVCDALAEAGKVLA